MIPVKILGNGEIEKKIEITADAFSQSAIEKIEKNREKYKDILSVRVGIYSIYETIDYKCLYDKYLKI